MSRKKHRKQKKTGIFEPIILKENEDIKFLSVFKLKVKESIGKG